MELSTFLILEITLFVGLFSVLAVLHSGAGIMQRKRFAFLTVLAFAALMILLSMIYLGLLSFDFTPPDTIDIGDTQEVLQQETLEQQPTSTRKFWKEPRFFSTFAITTAIVVLLSVLSFIITQLNKEDKRIRSFRQRVLIAVLITAVCACLCGFLNANVTSVWAQDWLFIFQLIPLSIITVIFAGISVVSIFIILI